MAKPTINLTPLRNTVVTTRTQEEHMTLLRVFEIGGWTWLMGNLPTTRNNFDKFREETYLTAEDRFLYGSIQDAWILDGRKRIISPENFYNIQGVTLREIMEINALRQIADIPQGRKELTALEIAADGTLTIKGIGTLVGGTAFSRLTDRDNSNCPEYILGQMALKAGAEYGEVIDYELRIKPK